MSPASSRSDPLCWTVAHAKNQVTEGVNLKQSIEPSIDALLQRTASGDLGAVYAELGEPFRFLRECNPLSVFYFGAHFTVVDNNEKRVTEGRSFSAL